jgi:hypothetical protein
MWYSELGVVSIGVQNGGPADGGLGDIKVDLWRLLCRHCQNSHCPAIDHYALALRIVARLKRDKEIVDEPLLFDQIDAAITAFRQIDYDGATTRPGQA